MLNGLLPVEKMVQLANTLSPPQMTDNPTGAINTTASLGIGSPPSAGKSGDPDYTWEALLCKMSSNVQSTNAKYNIMNIGGWGPGGSPILWQKSDIPGDADIDLICTFMQNNNYQGISFDLEGLYPGWTSDGCDKLLNDACGKIKKKGFMVWIVIPAFNVKTQYGGPLKITNPDNITLVQLMCYGKGLDSKWGGDPTGAPMTAQQIEGTISQLGLPPDKIMLAWSYLSLQESDFTSMMQKLGSKATAGCFAWCYGNTRVWTWSGKKVATGNLGSCLVPGP